MTKLLRRPPDRGRPQKTEAAGDEPAALGEQKNDQHPDDNPTAATEKAFYLGLYCDGIVSLKTLVRLFLENESWRSA